MLKGRARPVWSREKIHRVLDAAGLALFFALMIAIALFGFYFYHESLLLHLSVVPPSRHVVTDHVKVQEAAFEKAY
jgi:hypothetical protein